MTSISCRATTAILAAVSLLQPLPSLAQGRSGGNARSPEQICTDAGIPFGPPCRIHIEGLQAAARAAAEARSRPRGNARSSEQICTDAGIPFGPPCRIHIEGLQAAAQANAAAAADAAAQAAARADARAASRTEAAAREAAAARDAAQAQAQSRPGASAGSAEQICSDAGIAFGPPCRAHIEGLQAAARANATAAAQAEADALAASRTEAAARDAAQAEVATETVIERGRRSSSEDFPDWRRGDERAPGDRNGPDRRDAVSERSDSGLSDLEKAGLLALGAVVVGAILTNGQRVQSNTGDRVVVVDDDGTYRVLKDDDALLREPGSETRTERFSDGSTRATFTRDDGSRIVTIRDADGRAVRRVRIDPDGREHLLIDDTREFEPVIVRDLPRPVVDQYDYREAADSESLREALLAADRRDVGRTFSLRQVREIAEVRDLAPEINLEAITFATGSAALQPSQAEQLGQLGQVLRELVAADPTELFLVEGHTDAVGDAGYNLLLSDRRAESVALAFSEYFGVPPENMVVQGYGERFLNVPTRYAERANRRVAVRRITALMGSY